MFIKERNIQHREPQDAAVELAGDLPKKQFNEWVDVPHHQPGMNVKPEPGYNLQSTYTYGAPSHPPCEGDELSLPRLEEESSYSSVHRPCPIEVAAVQHPRVTTGRLPSYDQVPRPPTGLRMTSFDQLPRPIQARMPNAFDERPLADILFDIYAEQMQHTEPAFENLW